MKLKEIVELANYKKNKNVEIEFMYDGKKVNEDENMFFGALTESENEDDDNVKKVVVFISSKPMKDKMEFDLEVEDD